MVWFQCEDCGENLKKPKLLNHFRCCSANKLSCIDCGETFGQQSVQGHNQCITEAEKYGPKGQLKASNAKPAKANNDSKPKPDFDINVGLSSRPPWFCSLCKTSATSKQTLLLHAEGKKHRAKARAFHASQHPKETDGSVANPKDVAGDTQNAELVEKKDEAVLKEQEVENGIPSAKKKRKSDVADDVSTKRGSTDNSHDITNGEVIQETRVKEEPEGRVKRTKVDASEKVNINTEEPRNKEIKWKKLIISVLKQNPDGTIKMKKLEKAVLKSLQEDGLTEDVDQLKEKLKHEINSSSKFRLDNKLVSLVVKS